MRYFLLMVALLMVALLSGCAAENAEGEARLWVKSMARNMHRTAVSCDTDGRCLVTASDGVVVMLQCNTSTSGCGGSSTGCMVLARGRLDQPLPAPVPAPAPAAGPPAGP